jgi:processive 1,2-diacylglycerol beta-glucosyltransferase
MMTQTLPLATLPSLALDAGTAAPRVAVITGSYGAGHNSAAREIARVLTTAGCDVQTHDIVALLPWRLGPFLRTVYYAQLRRRPGSWGTTLRLLEPGRRAHRLVTRRLRFAAAPVVRATRGCDLVITTHPFGAQALGHARRAGQLTAPAVTYLTDTSVHSLWIHPGIDLNLAVHEVAANEARRWGGPTEVVRPLVPLNAPAVPGRHSDEPIPGVDLAPWALVTGGSLGMGQLENTARDILIHGQMTRACCAAPTLGCGAVSHGSPGSWRWVGATTFQRSWQQATAWCRTPAGSPRWRRWPPARPSSPTGLCRATCSEFDQPGDSRADPVGAHLR